MKTRSTGLAGRPFTCLVRARPSTASRRDGWQAVPRYPAEGIPRRVSARIASFCSVAAGGCPVASCSSCSSSPEMRCKPAMKSPRAAGSSRIRAYTAHASSSGESRLAVRSPIASCMALPAIVWPPSAPANGVRQVGPRSLRHGRRRRPPPGCSSYRPPSHGRAGLGVLAMGAHIWQHAGNRGIVQRPALAVTPLPSPGNRPSQQSGVRLGSGHAALAWRGWLAGGGGLIRRRGRVLARGRAGRGSGRALAG
jgi:hypothetical protein